MQQINAPVHVTETVHGREALDLLLEGVKLLHDPVASTLGASGRTVILEDKGANPKPTKDGVTVAKHIVPLDSFVRMGSEILKQASLQTAEEAGDGTTTSTVIAKAIIDRGIEMLGDKKINYTDFNRGMQMAYKDIESYLDNKARKVTLDNVESVATISANNDAELGKLIADAFKKAGEDGIVLMEDSLKSTTTEIKHTEGFELPKGYINEVFVTDPARDRVVQEDAFVLISNTKIERIEQIERFLAEAIKTDTPITIVSEFEDEVLAILGNNKIKRGYKFNAVNPSHFGVRRRDILTDLGVATGALVFDPDTGDNFDSIPDQEVVQTMGRARQVVTDRKKTVFFYEMTDQVRERVASLKERLSNERDPREAMYIKERISKISSSVVTISVGASSEAEQSEIADRVDDAIHATKAALEGGIVSGGGVALFNAASMFLAEAPEPGLWQKIKSYFKGRREPFSSEMSYATVCGYNVVMEAAQQPLRRILSNGDYQFKNEDYKIHGEGIDIRTRRKVDMIEAGIIDPVLVTKATVRNAISAASTLLSTTTVIVNLRKM